MILSNVEIKAAIDAGQLEIDPAPLDLFSNTTALDLRLGDELLILQERRAVILDPSAGGIADFIRDSSKLHNLRTDGPFDLEHGVLVLGKTLERIHLKSDPPPGRPHLAARIEGRSSFARCGVLVHFTAPTIHAGFPGTITLEIMNLGPNKVRLKYGIAFCQLILEIVHGEPIQAPSQFHGQSHPAGR